jgi:hypothetical protein
MWGWLLDFTSHTGCDLYLDIFSWSYEDLHTVKDADDDCDPPQVFLFLWICQVNEFICLKN